MDFGYDARTVDLRKRLLAFMDERIYPAEAVFAEQVAAAVGQGRPWERVPITSERSITGGEPSTSSCAIPAPRYGPGGSSGQSNSANCSGPKPSITFSKNS